MKSNFFGFLFLSWHSKVSHPYFTPCPKRNFVDRQLLLKQKDSKIDKINLLKIQNTQAKGNRSSRSIEILNFSALRLTKLMLFIWQAIEFTCFWCTWIWIIWILCTCGGFFSCFFFIFDFLKDKISYTKNVGTLL